MITVVPANEASAADLELIFGQRGTPSWCRCQWFKIRHKDWDAVPVPERVNRLREQTGCGTPNAAATSGLVGYLDGDPAGWCAVEPRNAYPRLETSRLVWAGRSQDPADETVWAVTCFVTRVGYRRRGVSGALAAQPWSSPVLAAPGPSRRIRWCPIPDAGPHRATFMSGRCGHSSTRASSRYPGPPRAARWCGSTSRPDRELGPSNRELGPSNPSRASGRRVRHPRPQRLPCVGRHRGVHLAPISGHQQVE